MSKQSASCKIAVNLTLLITDQILCCALGVVMIFVMFVLNGAAVNYLMEFGPSVITETAVIHSYLSKILHIDSYVTFNKRHSKYTVFICYYALILILAFLSTHAQYQVLLWVWYPRNITQGVQLISFKPQITGFIALHQVLTFVVLTSHNSWFDGYLLQKTDAIASAVLQCVATWIIWGIFVNNSMVVDNVAQLGSFLQWIPLTNLMSVSIFKDLDLSSEYQTISSKAGNLCLQTTIVNIMHWAIAYGITILLFQNDYRQGKLSPTEIGHAIWGFSTISWLPFQILGNRISPLIYKKICRDKSNNTNWNTIFYYFLLMTALAVLISAVFYIFYNYVMYDIVICRLLGYKNQENECKATPWYHRPTYFFGLGVGTIYLLWVETIEFSDDHVPKVKKEKQIKKKKNNKQHIEPKENIENNDLLS